MSSSSKYDLFESQVESKYKSDVIQPTIEAHKKYIIHVINHQEQVYSEHVEFFSGGNHETIQIKELKTCIDYLKFGLDIPIINEECETNPVLHNLRNSLMCSILAVHSNEDLSYLYGPSIRVIFKIIDFYDIFIRSIRTIGEKLPEYYHKYRYERYIEYCITFKQLMLVPTFAYIGATDLLKLRPYPIFIVGITIANKFVDEFFQSPVEYFIHDVNHCRRMADANIKDMIEREIDVDNYHDVKSYFDYSSRCLQTVLKILNNKLTDKTPIEPNVVEINIPTLKQKSIEFKKIRHLELDNYSDIDESTQIDEGYSQIIKLIVFEITHEDALPMQPDIICKTMMRISGHMPYFPRLTVGDESAKVVIKQQYGGSILGYIKYKLRYGFFDNIDNPISAIVHYYYRTDRQIAIASQILMAKLCGIHAPRGEELHDKILINITDKNGINYPVRSDLLKHYMPDVITTPLTGDLTDDESNELRKKYGINHPNEYTGIRPEPITEQGNMLLKTTRPHGGSVKKITKQRAYKKSKINKTKKSK